MNRLVTIAVSPFCEKARWGLDLVGLPYTEHGHVPMLHWASSFGSGGRKTVPVLALDDGPVLADSTDILEALAQRAPQLGLYGAEPAQTAEIRTWEERFDTALGPHARRWAYHHLFQTKPVLMEILKQGSPGAEVAIFSAIYPVAQLMMRRAMRIDEAGYRRSLEVILTCFGEVERALSDGRPFLVGGRFSAADLSFASMASILILPPHLPVPLPPREAYLPRMGEEILRFQESVAGKFARRLYEENRPRRPPVSRRLALPG